MSQKNGRLTVLLAAIVLSGVLAILGVGFANQSTMTSHNSAQGPHGEINTDLATIKADVQWIREKLEEIHE